MDTDFDRIVSLLDKSYNLVYVDYRDNLNNNLDKIAKSIRSQDWSYIDEEIFEWYIDSQYDSVDYILKELVRDVSREFDIEDEEAEILIEKYRDDLQSIIYDRDNSDTLKDLIRNTQEPVMFYDLGVEVYDGCLCDEKELKEKLKEIKKALNIKLSNKDYDSNLEMMIRQGDSGNLVVYFNADINEMMQLDNKNVVEFSNPMVAIINTWNGSGDHVDLPKHKLSIPMNIENFFMDKETKYSYTYEVCGMYSSWCDCTGVKFYKRSIKTSPAKSNSNIKEEQQREENYKQVYKSGKCSLGDMNMRRHRRTIYINDFPCGTKCLDCGNFWID